MASTSNTMLNKGGKNEHPCFVPDLEENVFSFFPLSLMLVVNLSYMSCITLRYVPPTSPLLRIFIINECWNLSNAFSHILI